MRKILFRIILVLLLIPIVLFTVGWIALQFSGPQNWATQQVVNVLSKKLETKISLDRIDIAFVKTISISGLYIEDKQLDTLLYAGNIKASIALFSFFDKKLNFNQIKLENITANLDRRADQSFNFDFISEAFTETTSVADTSATPWGLAIQSIHLNNSKIKYSDVIAQQNINAAIGKLEISVEELDLEKLQFEINNIELNDSQVSLELTSNSIASSRPLEKPSLEKSNDAEITFPEIPIQLNIDQFIQEENQFNITLIDEGKDITNQHNIYFDELLISKVALDMDNIEADIRLTNTIYNELPHLEQFTLNIKATPSNLAVNNMLIKTGETIIKNNLSLSFSNLNNLISNLKFQELNFNFVENNINSNDILDFAPLFLSQKQIDKFPKNKTIRLSGKIAGTSEVLTLRKIDFDLGENNDLVLSGKIANFKTQPKFDINLDNFQASYDGLKYWLPASLEIPNFSHLGNVNAKGKIKGTITDLYLTDFELITQANTSANGDFHFLNATDMESFSFEVDGAKVSSNALDLQPLLSDTLPKELYNLENFGYVGNIDGTTQKFNIDGQLNSAPGTISASAQIDFSNDYKDATYEGTIGFEKFSIGELLGDTLLFGELSMALNIEGNGLSKEDVFAKVKGTVNSFAYNSYDYQNLNINGALNSYKFTGNFDINDPNIALDFEGHANLDPDNLSAKLALNIDTINFEALNFLSEPLALSSSIKGDFTGKNIDEILGDIHVEDLHLSNGKHTYSDTLISLIAKEEEVGKRLEFNSEALDMDITGQFKILDLPMILELHINDYFPLSKNSESDRQILAAINPDAQKFKLNINIKNLEGISSIFLPTPLKVDHFSGGEGIVDTEKGILNFQLRLLDAEYNGNTVDSITLTAIGDEEILRSSIALTNLKNDGLANFPRAIVEVELKEKKGNFNINIADGPDSLFSWSGVATSSDDIYNFKFGQDLVITNIDWKVDKNNNLSVGQHRIELTDFLISKENQRIELSLFQDINEPLDATVNFSDLRLKEFSEILNNPDLTFSGLLNGSATVNDLTNAIKINSDLQIDDLALNQTPLGKFVGTVVQSKSTNPLDINLTLSEDNEAKITGKYDLSNGNLDMTANLQDLSTKLVLTGARYFSNQGKITLSNEEIAFSNFILKDKEGNSSELIGSINHNFFQDIQLDLKLNTDRFKILNTTRKDNSLYNGTAYASAEATVSGPIELMNIDVQAKTLTGTKIEVQPLYDDLSVNQEDYIIFGNPNEISPENNTYISSYTYNNTGFDLQLDLDVTDDTEISIVIDPLTGDQLDATGDGELIISMPPNGKVNILGTYKLTKGAYNFSYENLVKRKFTIDPSSTLTFVGDPLNTQFNLKALYSTNTSPLPLIENEATSLSESILRLAKRKVMAAVVMNIQGNLKEPSFVFDLDVGKSSVETINQLVNQKLDNLRGDQSNLNKQVFGLLLFNNFISESSNTGLANAPTNQVLSSVSSLVSNQLNNLAGKYFSGVNLELDFNSYQTGGEEDTNVSELNLQLSKQLFNDKLTIKVGGDFGLQNQTNSSLNEGGYSSIAGNFVLEYQLDDSGKYLLRVFHKTDYEALLETSTNKTGVGIRFNKSY